MTDAEPTKDNLKTLHKLIKKVSEDIEVFSYNTSIPAFMIAVGELAQQKCTSRAVLEQVVALLAPFAPTLLRNCGTPLATPPRCAMPSGPSMTSSI